MDPTKVKYYSKICSTGSVSSFPILICPKCNQYKINMYQHSKSKKCNFDFKKVFEHLFLKNEV